MALEERNLDWKEMWPPPSVFKLRGPLRDLSWSWLYRVPEIYSLTKLNESNQIVSNPTVLFSWYKSYTANYTINLINNGFYYDS